jgi:hypothetical protein
VNGRVAIALAHLGSVALRERRVPPDCSRLRVGVRALAANSFSWALVGAEAPWPASKRPAPDGACETSVGKTTVMRRQPRVRLTPIPSPAPRRGSTGPRRNGGRMVRISRHHKRDIAIAQSVGGVLASLNISTLWPAWRSCPACSSCEGAATPWSEAVAEA